MRLPPRGRAVEVLVDCPTCRVEGARVELVADEIAAESRCRLCGERAVDGVVVVPGLRFVDEAVARDALAGWAREEGEDDVDAFVRANFSGRDRAQVCAALVAGEPVETSLEVVAWLFGGRGAFAGVSALGARLRHEDEPTDAVELAAVTSSPTAFDPRDVTRALCAIVLADGRVHPAEEPLLAEALLALGAPVPTPTDRRVWRPNEVGPVADPAATLSWMRRLALADAEADPSEVRLLRAYARAWRADVDAIEIVEPAWWVRLGQAWTKWRRGSAPAA